jgi:hypothetical protein
MSLPPCGVSWNICLPSASFFKLYEPMMNSTHVHILIIINHQWMFTVLAFSTSRNSIMACSLKCDMIFPYPLPFQ